MLVEKEVIRPGQYWYRDEATGQPRKLTVTPELTRYWHEQGNAMLATGLTVPVPCEHDFNAHPMTPAEKLKNNAGWVRSYSLKGDALFSSVDVEDEALAAKLPKTIRWTSPWINSFTDGNGKEWKNVISHLALTTRPRIVEQEPFGSVAAALSMATPVQQLPDNGFCLSRAGKLDDYGLPKFPVAFSLYSGVKLATDATGHEHAADGKFGKGSGSKTSASKGQFSTAHAHTRGAHEISKEASLIDDTDHSANAIKASSDAHVASHKGQTATAAMHHHVAAMHHVNAAKEHHKAGRHEQAAIHAEAASAHFGASQAHSPYKTEKPPKKGGAAMAMDFGGKKSPTKPKPDQNAPSPDVGVDDDETPDEGMDIEEGDDLDADDPSAMDDNGNGTVEMEEILCHLLQALGVPMPDNSNSNEFHRHLYEAAMSKIKELTSKGMGVNDPGKNPPDQNKPPNQQPNASQPKQQPNPLIQQEPQPMFMSLEEINQLPDPMKGVALSWYHENVKLQAEVDANKKVTNGLRNKQLEEANQKRHKRVALINALSPRAKADLDAMLSQESMALSMDDKGNIIDPMSQTLAVLEKGLSDLPQLFQLDAAQLSVQAHPQDADALTGERSDEIADVFARQMGCVATK